MQRCAAGLAARRSTNASQTAYSMLGVYDCSRVTGKPEIIHNEKSGWGRSLYGLRNQAFALTTGIA